MLTTSAMLSTEPVIVKRRPTTLASGASARSAINGRESLMLDPIERHDNQREVEDLEEALADDAELYEKVRLRMQDILNKPVSTVTVQDINELWVLKDDLRKLGRQNGD